MKKKTFIMILLIIVLIVLSILIFIQINNLKNINKDLNIQIEKLSSYQNSDIEENYAASSSIEANASSKTYLEITNRAFSNWW